MVLISFELSFVSLNCFKGTIALSETILWLQYISCFSYRYYANEFSSPLGTANIARAIRGIVKSLERQIRRAISGPL